MSRIEVAPAPSRPWDFNEIFRTTFVPIALAAVVTALPVFFHLASQIAGIAVCTLLALMVVVFAAETAPVVLFFSYLFQNLVVAFVSPLIQSAAELDAMRAYGFLLTIVIWGVLFAQHWLDRAGAEPRVRRLMTVTTASLALIGVYFALGVALRAPAAVIYLRNIASPIMLLQIFALVAYRHRLSIVGPLTLMAILTLVYGYLELLNNAGLMRAVHGDVYMNWRIKADYDAGVWVRTMQQTGFVMRSYLDTLAIDFLNSPFFTSLNLQVHRLLGPNFHPISFAYALAVLGIFLGAVRRWWYVILALPLLLVIGSKGALTAMLLVGGMTFLVTFFRPLRRLWLFVAILIVYAVFGIITGIRAEDYHVLGFIGGLRGFAGNPLGHGIGAGGNLSMNMATLDWGYSQHVGHTNVAVESAVGVLLYQMGIAAFAILALFGWVATTLWRFYKTSGIAAYGAAAFGVLAITFNGIFQEEALFAPLALTAMMAIAGLLLGSAYRLPTRAAAARREAM